MIKSIVYLIMGILIADLIVITILFMQQNDVLLEARAQISTLEAQVKTLNEESFTLRGRISILESFLAESEGNVLALQARLRTSEMNANPVINRVPELDPGVEPAAFSINKLAITPSKVEAGSNITAVVTITNTGEQSGTYRVLLQIREYSLEINEDRGEDVTLAAGETREVTFSIILFDKGEYVLSVGKFYHDLLVTEKTIPST